MEMAAAHLVVEVLVEVVDFQAAAVVLAAVAPLEAGDENERYFQIF